MLNLFWHVIWLLRKETPTQVRGDMLFSKGNHINKPWKALAREIPAGTVKKGTAARKTVKKRKDFYF